MREIYSTSVARRSLSVCLSLSLFLVASYKTVYTGELLQGRCVREKKTREDWLVGLRSPRAGWWVWGAQGLSSILKNLLRTLSFYISAAGVRIGTFPARVRYQALVATITTTIPSISERRTFIHTHINYLRLKALPLTFCGLDRLARSPSHGF